MKTVPQTSSSSLLNNSSTDDPMDDCDDIFGPPRTYPTAYPPKNRPSMISAKYKLKEERRKVLKISLNKLKKIDDPESNLCRSVLINNTMKRLQQETRDEKLQKQQLSYPRCYSSSVDSYLNIKTEFLKNEKLTDDLLITNSFNNIISGDDDDAENERIEEVVIENDFHARLEEEITGINSLVSLNNFEQNTTMKNNNIIIGNNNGSSSSVITKKRTFDEIVDDCDMHDVLSQFYMPPTPRMLTAMDDDEDVNVVDPDPLIKRLKFEENSLSTSSLAVSSSSSSASSTTTSSASFSDYTKSVTSYINNNLPTGRFNNSCGLGDSENNSYSCGQASMFSEMQTNVYHSLIASLET